MSRGLAKPVSSDILYKYMKSIWLKRLGLTILVITFIAVVYGWWVGSGQIAFKGTYGFLRSMANLAAFAAAYGILLQLVLIARIPWLNNSFGMDKLARLHHILGFSIPAAIVAHPLLLVAASATSSDGTWWTIFWNFVNNYEDVGNAAIAAILFLLLVAVSMAIVFGKMKYETWYLAHLMMYAGVILALGHQFKVGDDMYGWYAWMWYGLYALVFGSVAVFRFILPLYRFRKYGFKVEEVVQEGLDSWSVYITGRDLGRLEILAGQFFIVRFLDRDRWWQAHPFSLSCAPNAQHIRLTIKALGDFTRELKTLKTGVKVVLDGPHGAFTEASTVKDKAVLIAGGVGITPIMSLCESWVPRGKDVVMLYGARLGADLVFRSKLDELSTTQSNYRIHYVLSDDADWQGEKGYMDQEKLARLVPDMVERDVYVCGPKPMLKTVLAVLKAMKIPKTQIHFESFSL